jgi:flagellin
MSVVINTNYAAIVASNNLAASSAMLQKSLARLSSGSKIINSSDDAGGLAVSMKLSAAALRQGDVATNIGNATSLLQTQDGALSVTGSILSRIGELKTLSGDVTKSASDKANYDTEFQALQAQLTANTSEKFNGVSMFGSNSIGNIGVTEDGVTTVSVGASDLASSSAGIGALTSSGITSLADISIAQISTAIQHVADLRANNGALQSRLGFASTLDTTNQTNLEQADSRISDVDVAQESTQLARFNVLVQAGTSMLTQANQSSQVALKLLQG